MKNMFYLKYFFIQNQVRETLTLTACTGVVTKVLPNTTEKINGFNVSAGKKITQKK